MIARHAITDSSTLLVAAMLIEALAFVAAFGGGFVCGILASRNMQAGLYGLAKHNSNQITAVRKDIVNDGEKTRRQLERRQFPRK